MYLTEEQKRAMARSGSGQPVAQQSGTAQRAPTQRRAKLDLNALRQRVAPNMEASTHSTSYTLDGMSEQSKPAEQEPVKQVEPAKPAPEPEKPAEPEKPTGPAKPVEPAREEPKQEEPVQQNETAERAPVADTLTMDSVASSKEVKEDAVPEIELQEETPEATETVEEAEVEAEAPQAEEPANTNVLDPELKTGAFNVIDLHTLLGLMAPNGGLFDQSVLEQWVSKCLVKYSQAPTNIFTARFNEHIRFVNFNYLDNRINVVLAYGDNIVCLAYSQAKHEIHDVSQQLVADGDKAYYRSHLMTTYAELARKAMEV